MSRWAGPSTTSSRITCKGLRGDSSTRELLYVVAGESYQRVLDLERFGVNFRYPDSKLPGNFRIVPQFHSVPTTFNFDGRDLKPILTKEAKKRGVAIVNRVMMVELIIADGQVAGCARRRHEQREDLFFQGQGCRRIDGQGKQVVPRGHGRLGQPPCSRERNGRRQGHGPQGGAADHQFGVLYSRGVFHRRLRVEPRLTEKHRTACRSVVGPAGEAIVPRTHFYDWEKLGKEKIDPLESRRVFLEARSMPPYSQMHREGKGPFYLDLTGGTEEEIRYIEWSIGNEGKGSLFLEYLKNQEKFDFRKDKLEWLP